MILATLFLQCAAWVQGPNDLNGGQHAFAAIPGVEIQATAGSGCAITSTITANLAPWESVYANYGTYYPGMVWTPIPDGSTTARQTGTCGGYSWIQVRKINSLLPLWDYESTFVTWGCPPVLPTSADSGFHGHSRARNIGLMTNPMPSIRPMQQGDAQLLAEAVAADDHHALCPTHLVRKGGELVGYLGHIPLVTFWMDSRKAKPRDSLHVLSAADALWANTGTQRFATICADRSPFRKYMKDLGYTHYPTQLFLREL